MSALITRLTELGLEDFIPLWEAVPPGGSVSAKEVSDALVSLHDAGRIVVLSGA